MNDLKTYLPPMAETITLQGCEHILDLSNYGPTGEPGSSFDSGNLIDNPVLF